MATLLSKALPLIAVVFIAFETVLMLFNNRRLWRMITIARLTARLALVGMMIYLAIQPIPITSRGQLVIAILIGHFIAESAASLARRMAGSLVQ